MWAVALTTRHGETYSGASSFRSSSSRMIIPLTSLSCHGVQFIQMWAGFPMRSVVLMIG